MKDLSQTISNRSLRASPWAALLFAVACSGTTSGTGPVGGSGSGGSGSQTGGSGEQAESGSGSGASASGESASGSGGSGASAGQGSGASSGVSSASGFAASGTTGGSGAAASGTSSSGSSASGSGASGAGGDGGNPMSTLPSGKSPGCGMAPSGAAVLPALTDHKITIPSCGNGVNYPDCIAAAFSVGGSSYEKANGEDYNNRDYTIGIPTNYDPNTAYPIVFGGGGCGGTPPQTGNGFGVNETGAIEIGMQYINGCFADGGGACSGNGPIANCDQGPELPYFRAILKQVESEFCIDVGRVFVGGYSSGGWEAFTLGCGGANLIRGQVSDEGGWRNDQPACTGPIAALMVAGEADGTNPIGPLMMNTAYAAGGLSASQVNGTIQSLDSFGSAPGRDAILQRNNCIGTNTTTYDSNYPQCVQYTGCPAAFPVVWCPLPGVGHNDSTYPTNGTNYSPGSVKGDPLMWNFLSKLPALN